MISIFNLSPLTVIFVPLNASTPTTTSLLEFLPLLTALIIIGVVYITLSVIIWIAPYAAIAIFIFVGWKLLDMLFIDNYNS